MKQAIIFGITGQDGSHLADLLLSKDYQVIGVTRRCSTENTQRIKHIKNNNRLKLVEGDITDISSIMGILSSYENVDEVYNLAAQSHVGTSFKQPGLTWDITGKGCMNILQAIVDLGIRTRFYQASSSEMFGSSYDIDKDGNKYQNEDTKFLPNSPYAICKCAAHQSVRLYREAYNLHASCGILFNHEGPRRGDNFVTKKIINWILDFKEWLEYFNMKKEYLCFTEEKIIGINDLEFPKLRLGNLEAFRDWGYAGDYVEAMWLMLQQQYPDDYVICTGETHTVAEFLDIAFSTVNLPEWRNYVYIDPEFYRPSEVDYLRGDCLKAKEKLGWQPKHKLEDLIKLMLNETL
jgi:GDPmannose 4,6-dehydratase